MTQNVFVAFSRSDRETVTHLVADVRSLGYSVMLDNGLPGGDVWWAETLERVAHADVFIYAISEASLDSESCKAQLRYATDIGIPALPVVVGEDVSDALVLPELARLQRVDYRSASKRALAGMYRSIEQLDAPHLRPAQRPEVPRGVALDLADVTNAEYLAPEEQLVVVDQLRTLLQSGVVAERLTSILIALQGRDDLTVVASEQLGALSDLAPDPATQAAAIASDPMRPADQEVVDRVAVRRIFISYSRLDIDRVSVLAEDLRRAGFEAWLDQELPGGMKWWDEVLRQIREADVMVQAVSEQSRDSRACASELEYAHALHKPVVGVAVEREALGPTGGNGSAEAPYDFTTATKVELAAVISAVRSARPSSLPATLPEPPPIPATYLFDIRSEIRADTVLTPAAQMAIVEQLQQYNLEDVPRQDIARLAADLRNRDDLTVAASQALHGLPTEEASAPRAGDRTGEPTAVGPQQSPGQDSAANQIPASDETQSQMDDPVAVKTPGAVPAEDHAQPEMHAAELDSPSVAVPKRSGRKKLVVLGIVIAVIGAVIVGSVIDSAGDGDDFSPGATIALSASDPESDVATTANQPAPELTQVSDVDSDTITGFYDDVLFYWTLEGIEYEADLSIQGWEGVVDITYLHPNGTWVVIRQDLQAEKREGDDWAFLGSNPRLADTGESAASFYLRDHFHVVATPSGWYIEEACGDSESCVPVY